MCMFCFVLINERYFEPFMCLDNVFTLRSANAGSMSETVLDRIQTHKRFKGTLFIRTKHNTRILGLIPLINLRNDT